MRSRRPMVTVVIAARDAADVLPVQLDALTRQTYDGPWEVVVVDDGSKDGTADVARRWVGKVPGLSVIVLRRSEGIAGARNAGARAARGDVLLFCDADDAVAPQWVASMAEASRRCDLLGGRLALDALNPPHVRARYPDQFGTALLTGQRFLPHPSGSNCGMTRDAFTRLGGFNPAHRYGGEDVDLFWRAQLLSYDLCFVSDALVQRRLPTTLAAMARRSFRLGAGDVRIYHDFRQHGYRPSCSRAMTALLRVVVTTPAVVSGQAQRAAWVRSAAFHAGRLVASLRLRVFLP